MYAYEINIIFEELILKTKIQKFKMSVKIYLLSHKGLKLDETRWE